LQAAKFIGTEEVPSNGCVSYGTRHLLVVQQGYVGIALDEPSSESIFPPGIHDFTSETLKFKRMVALGDPVVRLGLRQTLLTVGQGCVAVTKRDGALQILNGGQVYLLDHANTEFKEFLSLRVRTDDLGGIDLLSEDRIGMVASATVTWRVVTPVTAVRYPDLSDKVLRHCAAWMRSHFLQVAFANRYNIWAKNLECKSWPSH